MLEDVSIVDKLRSPWKLEHWCGKTIIKNYSALGWQKYLHQQCLTTRNSTTMLHSLSKLDNTCKDKCPDGLTVLEDPTTKHCEVCDDICGTC